MLGLFAALTKAVFVYLCICVLEYLYIFVFVFSYPILMNIIFEVLVS